MTRTNSACPHTDRHLAWITVLAPIVADALSGADENRLHQARAVTLAAFTCLDVRSAKWLHHDGAVGNGQLLDEEFALLELTALTLYPTQARQLALRESHTQPILSLSDRHTRIFLNLERNRLLIRAVSCGGSFGDWVTIRG